MTAPDSRDSVERIAEELRAYDGDPFGTAKHVFRGWADRLQAIARDPTINSASIDSKSIAGPQQADWSEDPVQVAAHLASETACLRIDNERLQAEVARLREARELLLQVKHFGGTKAGAIDAFLTRTDKGPKDG